MEALVAEPGTLRDWVREHRVTWELLPHFEMHGHAKVQVGFELQLFARHPEPLSPDDPGCPECVRIYETLLELAQGVLPKMPQPTRTEMSPFDASFHLRPEAQWAPEVELVLDVVHAHGTFAPVDLDEREYVQEVEEGLRRLGAQSRVWTKR